MIENLTYNAEHKRKCTEDARPQKRPKMETASTQTEEHEKPSSTTVTTGKVT
jgi:hypothetical protein